jgi:hypothetical protein
MMPRIGPAVSRPIDNAAELPVVHDQQRRNALRTHLRRTFLDRRRCLDRDRRAGYQLPDRLTAGAVELCSRGTGQQAVRQQPDEMRVEARVLAAQFCKYAPIDVVDE